MEVPAPGPIRAAGIPPEAEEATVVRHVDGDTLWLEGGTLPPNAVSSVRLLEIDSPEVGTRYAQEATDFLKGELPLGSRVWLLADEEDTDRFGRFLRYLWKSNGEFLNEKAVRLGYARAVLFEPNDAYISQMRAAEAEAQAARRGIWATDSPPGPGAAAAGEGLSSECHPSYPDFCIPPPPPDLDCRDIGRRFTVRQPDPHRFDGMPGQVGEPDGIGCESYR